MKPGSKRRRTKQEIADEERASIIEHQRSKAKLEQYDALQAKVEMMEHNSKDGQAALDLIDQLLKTGFVTQDDEGSFVVPGINGEKKFKPFEGE